METKKIVKPARKTADNSTFLQSDSFLTNLGKSQGYESVIVTISKKETLD